MRFERLAAVNYRGVPLSRVLGLVVLGNVVAVSGVAFLGRAPDSRASLLEGWIPLAACSLVFAVGLVDDLAPRGPRGIRAHLRGLASGHMTTGILKAMVVGAASIVTVAALGQRSFLTEVAGVALLAASSNLWNGLDVLPGRAIKAFLAVAVFAPVTVSPWRIESIVGGAFLGASVSLWFDLRERAMLGDGGSNLLGFVIGLFLYEALPGWGVGLVASLMVGLNVAAETITLSRMIEATPPLRWFDTLGRTRGG